MPAGELVYLKKNARWCFLLYQIIFCSIQSFFFTCTPTKYSVCYLKYMSGDNFGVADLRECHIVVELLREEECFCSNCSGKHKKICAVELLVPN
jgi:hypothetical protein